MASLEFYDPSGRINITKKYAPRLQTLNGKRIGFLSSDQWQADRTLPVLKAAIEEDFPGAEVLSVDEFPTGEFAVGSDATIQMVKERGVDGVFIGNAACGSCTTALSRAAARLEGEGIPTVLLGRTDFLGVVRNAVSGMGFPPELPVVDFPVETFLPESDLSAIRNRKREFYEGLTDRRSERNAAETCETPLVTVTGTGVFDALLNANKFLLASRWGDGLPLWPATKDYVEWILQGTTIPRDHVLGQFLPRGAVATVESCAIALAMAGGRPEYLPVFIAAVDAFLDPLSDAEHMQADSAGAFPVIIVNGPIGPQIRLSSNYGCLGPDPQRPAGASIGRGLRLMQQNLGGALPGVGAMATWGAMRYTNAVFAEDEANLPNGWRPHATERHGFASGSNSVSLMWATSVTNIRCRSPKGGSAENEVLYGMRRIAKYVRSPNIGCLIGYTAGTPGVLMISHVLAKAMSDLGWTKGAIRDFLWNQSKLSVEERRFDGIDAWIEEDHDAAVRASGALEQWPFAAKPENVIVLVCGGGHPANSYWMQGYSPNVVAREIQLPPTFSSLLRTADNELGCGDAACMI